MKGPVEESLPNSQTWLGLLAAEPIVSREPGGSASVEVVHDEPFQLAIAWLQPKIQTSATTIGRRR
jgi:hypothetical protein